MTWQRDAQNITKVLQCDSLTVYLLACTGLLIHTQQREREKRGRGKGKGEREEEGEGERRREGGGKRGGGKRRRKGRTEQGRAGHSRAGENLQPFALGTRILSGLRLIKEGEEATNYPSPISFFITGFPPLCPFSVLGIGGLEV